MQTPLSKVNIVEMLGLSDLPAKDRERIVSELAEMIEEKVLLRLSSVLSKEKMEELMSLLKTESDGQIAEFLETNISNFRKIISEESLACKRRLAGILDAVRAEEK